MNKKAFFAGFLLCCALCLSTAAFASLSALRYAVFNGNRVYFNDVLLDLKGARLISAAKRNELYPANYMPLRAVFEAMGLTVDWNAQTREISVSGVAKTPMTGTPQGVSQDVSQGVSQGVSPDTSPEDSSVNQQGNNSASAYGTHFNEYKSLKAPVLPYVHSTYEAQAIRLISQLFEAEMSADTGLCAIMNLARDAAISGSYNLTDAQIANGLSKTLRTAAEEGSGKLLRTLEALEATSGNSSSLYISARKSLSSYSDALNRARIASDEGDLLLTFAEFDSAYNIASEFFKEAK